MESFNKLAGVQDAQKLTSQPPPSTQWPEPPPIPQDDLESGPAHSLHSRPSRASLPMNRKPSSKSMRPASPSSLTDVLRQGPNGNRYTATRDSSRAPSEGVGGHGELPWGPQHPCFPHPNPHVPVASPLYSSTRIIRVKRDWLASGDLYPAYQNVYPEVLSDCLSEAEFRNVVETLNARLKAAYTPWSAGSWIDGVLSVATGGVWDDVGLTVGKRKADGVEKWIEEWNREMEKSGREVRLIGLKRTGYLSLDIQILDPGVDAEG